MGAAMDKPRPNRHKPRAMGLDFFRQAAWLDATRARGYLRVVALLNVATLVVLLATSHDGVDRNGFLIGTDFKDFWTTGRRLHEHGDYSAFFYPPFFLPFCWPLGFFAYFPALGLWLAVTGAAYLAAVRQWLKAAPIAQPLLVLFLAFPPVLITITHGQTSFLIAALLGLGALLVRERPWLAGALFGLAVIKPQFGLLVPVVLLLTREWRVIAGAMIAAAMLGLLSTVAFGPQIWADWLHASSTAQTAMNSGAVDDAKMQSTFAAAMLLGAPSAIAYALQGVVSLAVVAAVAWASWKRRYDLPLAALMLAGAPLVTPYVFDYDLLLLGFPLIWLATQGFGPWERLIVATTFVAAAFARPLALETSIPIMPVILAAFFVVLLRRVANKRLPAPA